MKTSLDQLPVSKFVERQPLVKASIHSFAKAERRSGDFQPSPERRDG